MTHLTPREREILALIARSIDRNGYQPSYREIAAHFGWSSLGWLHVNARNLTRKKVVVIKGARAWSFDWRSHLKEQGNAAHHAEGTHAQGSRHHARRHVRRGARR